MSQFLSEQAPGPGQRQGQGQDSSAPQQEAPPDFLTPPERSQLSRMLGYPEDLPKEFKSWILQHIAVNGLDIPVSQLHGFSGFRPKTAVSFSTVATNSPNYVDLGGPELEGVASGTYLVLFGFANSTGVDNGGGSFPTGEASVAVNGTPVGSAIFSTSQESDNYPFKTYFYVASVEGRGDNNTIGLRYRVGGTIGSGNRDWDGAWIVAIKIGN